MYGSCPGRKSLSCRHFQVADTNAALAPKPYRRPGVSPDLPFYPLSIAVLTVSDTRTEATDTSGGLLKQRLLAAGHTLAAVAIVADDAPAIQAQVRAWAADPGVDVILTTGGTGFAPRDVTPEAVRPLIDREMDGFSVVFHQPDDRGRLDAAVARARWTGGRDLHFLRSRIHRRVPRRLGPGARRGIR
jgi:molybdenum cofactor synthesis domain-containing protein